MGSEILRRDNQDAAPTSTPEVEFALVLSRMIDSVKSDPQHLRETVYELARHKLQEQFTHENVKDMGPISNALETAIRGVEAFARKTDQAAEEFASVQPALEKPRTLIDDGRSTIAATRPAPPVVEVAAARSNRGVELKQKNSAFAPVLRLAFLLVIIAAAVIFARQTGMTFETIRTKANLIISKVTTQPKTPVPAPVATSAPPEQVAVDVPPKPSPLVPTSYGIYAVSDEKLYQLELCRAGRLIFVLPFQLRSQRQAERYCPMGTSGSLSIGAIHRLSQPIGRKCGSLPRSRAPRVSIPPGKLLCPIRAIAG